MQLAIEPSGTYTLKELMLFAAALQVNPGGTNPAEEAEADSLMANLTGPPSA